MNWKQSLKNICLSKSVVVSVVQTLCTTLTNRIAKAFHLVRQMGLEPIRQRHTPLKRACLPIPALPQITLLKYNPPYCAKCQHFFLKNAMFFYCFYIYVCIIKYHCFCN